MGARTRTFEESNQLRDWFTLIMGIGMVGAPWVLAYANDAAASWSARLLGIAICLLAIGALLRYAEWQEWLALAAGLCLAASPWVFHFADGGVAKTVHLIVGALVAFVAAWELWDFRRLMAARAASERLG